MSKCPACGADVEQDAKFCPFCGTRLSVDPPQAPDAPENETPFENPFLTPPTPFSENPFEGPSVPPIVLPAANAVAVPSQLNPERSAKLQSIFGSPIWLCLCIFFTIAAVLSGIATLVSWCLGAFMLPLNFILVVAIAVGTWQCRKSANRAFDGKGLSTLRGATIYAYVLFWIAFAFLIIAAVMAFAGSGLTEYFTDSGADPYIGLSFVGAGFVLLVFAAIYLGVGLPLYLFALRFLKSTRESLYSAAKPQKAKPLAILLFVYAGISLFFQIASLVTSGGTLAVEIFDILGTAMDAVAMILTGICVLRSVS